MHDVIWNKNLYLCVSYLIYSGYLVFFIFVSWLIFVVYFGVGLGSQYPFIFCNKELLIERKNDLI